MMIKLWNEILKGLKQGYRATHYTLQGYRKKISHEKWYVDLTNMLGQTLFTSQDARLWKEFKVLALLLPKYFLEYT